MLIPYLLSTNSVLTQYFTHRVVRGVLLAVGRPDGRLSCLSKSEAAVILATKQAAYIQNPMYSGAGSGPDIVTVGHNPFDPNFGGVQASITLPSSTRGKFVDELLYERLFLATKPFAGAILRNLLKNKKTEQRVRVARAMSDTSSLNSRKFLRDAVSKLSPVQGQVQLVRVPSAEISKLNGAAQSKNADVCVDPPFSDPPFSDPPFSDRIELEFTNPIPPEDCFFSQSESQLQLGQPQALYGSQHIDPGVKKHPLFYDFMINCKDLLTPKCLSGGAEKQIQSSSDPSVRAAFASRLDTSTQVVQDMQVIVQHFYEGRIASLERYIAFCVMFHAMVIVLAL